MPPELSLDVDCFEQYAPRSLRWLVAARIEQIVTDAVRKKWRINQEFFGNLAHYNRCAPDWVESLDDLYPPNFAILDYLYQFVEDKKNARVLDLACGLGNLLVYLAPFGFGRVGGYDDWSQLESGLAEEFLNGFGLPNVLVKANEVTRDGWTILTIAGYWLEKVLDGLGGKTLPESVKLVLADSNYLPRTIQDFEPVAEYKDLAWVYRRIE